MPEYSLNKWNKYPLLALLGLGLFWLAINPDQINDGFLALREFYLNIQSSFNQIRDFAGDNSVYILPALIAVSITLLISLFPKPPAWLQALITFSLFLSHTIYIVFRTTNTISTNSPGECFASVILWLFDILFYLSSLVLYLQLLWPIDRRDQADKLEKDVLDGTFTPSVDIFIPSHSEPVNMVKRTLVACLDINYPNKKVFLLDNGNRPEMRSLTESLGCNYLARSNGLHAKAGNVNNGLKHTQGEIIAMFDADCVPAKNFLTRTIGFFQEKELALIISTQTFFNIRQFTHNTMSLLEASRFFRHTQMGRDRFNALLCYGTCFAVRRSAMEHIKGMPHETLSEDWATSIKLQAAGFKTYFLNEVLGSGAAAESMNEFVRQRIRWTQGTLQSLFASTNQLTIKGLSLPQRLIYSHGLMHYLLNPFYLITIFLPSLYFCFGFSPFDVTRGQFWTIMVPFFIFRLFTFSWICREYSSNLSSLVSESFLTVPLSIAAIKTLCRPFGWKFRVTQKDLYRTAPVFSRIIGLPIIFLLAGMALSATYGLINRQWYNPDLFSVLFYIALARILIMFISLYSAFDHPQQRKCIRFPCRLTGTFNGKATHPLLTSDLSEGGALLESRIPGEENTGTLSLPELGIANMPVTLLGNRQQRKQALRFNQLSLEHYRRIVSFLYCEPARWEDPAELDQRMLKAFISSLKFERIFHKPRTAIAGALLCFALTIIFARPAPAVDEFIAGPELTELHKHLQESNASAERMIMTVHRLAALSSYEQSFFAPSVLATANTGASGGNSLDQTAAWTHWASIPVSYEIDIWKKLRSRYSAAKFAATAQQEAITLMRLKFKAGLISKDKISPYKQSMDELTTLAATAEEKAASARHTIDALLGAPSKQNLSSTAWSLPEWVLYTPEPLPDTDLEKRPDLNSIRQRIIAANYSIEEIRAQNRPSLVTSGNIHTGGRHLSDLNRPENQGWGAFLTVNVPIFDAKRNASELASKQFSRNELAAQYREALLTAREEEMKAIETIRMLIKTLNSLKETIKLSAFNLRSEEQRFKAGISSRLEVLSARKNIALQKAAIIKTQQELINARIQYLRAIGSKIIR